MTVASIKDREEIGQEVVLRVQSTGSGVKVIRYDGTGFADGIMSKRNLRYFYGDEARQKATEYAYRKRDEMSDTRDCPISVIERGERSAERLPEVRDRAGGETDG